MTEPFVDDTPLWDLWLSQLWAPSVMAAMDCGVFDALKDAPMDAEALAGRLELDARSVRIVLSLVAALDMLTLREGRFHLTPQSRELLADGPRSWKPLLSAPSVRTNYTAMIAARLHGDAEVVAPEGDDAPPPVDGWEQADIAAEQAKGIAAFMHSHSVGPALGAAQVLDLSGARRLLDVGGGSGCFAIAFARRWPDLACTVMELEHMCAAVRDYVAEAGLEGRVDARTVDMFRQDWPGGYDAMFLSNIFHDWSDETCRDLAARAFAALEPGGRILLHEQVLDDDKAGPATTAAFSVLMLLGTRGRQYSFPELRDILEGAGFAEVSATATYGYYSVVSGVKPA